jgi:hypothetical protein
MNRRLRFRLVSLAGASELSSRLHFRYLTIKEQRKKGNRKDASFGEGDKAGVERWGYSRAPRKARLWQNRTLL